MTFGSGSACRSLRDWFARLDAAGELHRNPTPVGLRNDISYVAKAIADRGGPAVLHESIVDYPGW